MGTEYFQRHNTAGRTRLLTRSRVRMWLIIVLAILTLGACAESSTSTTNPFQGLDGCKAGAGSAIAFLQRTLQAIGDADIEEAPQRVPSFDHDVETMMYRAREVHCTEEGFNRAIVDRLDELVGEGAAAQMLIATVEARGLGSLDIENGGLITLSGE